MPLSAEGKNLTDEGQYLSAGASSRRNELAWSGRQVPLALAVEATEDRPSQLVVYRRPLEHRASSRRGLQHLVYRTVVEQLSALTGRSVSELDPDGAADDEDDD